MDEWRFVLKKLGTRLAFWATRATGLYYLVLRAHVRPGACPFVGQPSEAAPGDKTESLMD